MLNVHDKAFAKVTLGLFGVEEYLLRAFACYRGHAGYDINILKVELYYLLTISLTLSLSLSLSLIQF